MDIRITPGPLAGTVTPPPSKSIAHRAILAAALTNGTSTIQNVALSQDIEATLRCITALGGAWEREEDTLYVSGVWHREWDTAALPHLDCGESGSTLRFLIPLAVTLNNGGVFTGRGRLMERPQQPYFDIFDEKGISYEQKDGVLTIRGEWNAGKYRLPGNVSSQFVTGLLYALPLMEWESRIVLTSPLESRGYVDMTLDVLDRFGVRVEVLEDGFLVPGDQVFQARDFTIEADWSQAAFWMAAGLLGNPVLTVGLSDQSTQGDRVIDEHFASFAWGTGRTVEIDVSNCPDLLPPLAVMAAFHDGTTRLINAARLRLKESDRLATVTKMLTALGGQVEEGPDWLAIPGTRFLKGGTVDGANDHRIVMAAAIAATRCTGPVTILGAEAVNKSYPNFWEEYKRLGGIFDVL
jgi:3-phosphoshikimate 1-carboxyvinyltransferase